jgi:hypothetical protein
VNGIDVLIDEELKGYAERSTVDYITGPYGEGFKVGIAGSAC